MARFVGDEPYLLWIPVSFQLTFVFEDQNQQAFQDSFLVLFAMIVQPLTGGATTTGNETTLAATTTANTTAYTTGGTTAGANTTEAATMLTATMT